MSNQQTGRISIKLDSDTLRSKPGASLQTGGIVREFDATDQGEAIYKERIIPAQVTATMPHMADTDLARLRAWKGTAHFITDSGLVWTVANAATANIGDLSNGEVQITVGGDPATV